MRAFVLGREISGEKFWRLSVLSAEEGAFACLVRISAKGASVVPVLFDEAEIEFSAKKAGTEGARFVKEYAPAVRHTALGNSYAALLFASRLANLLTANAFPPDARAAIFALCGRTISALEVRSRRDAVFFKALWLTARESGLPVRQDWFARRTAEEQRSISGILKNPPDDSLNVPAAETNFLTQNLEDWLAREHDFAFPR